MHQCVYYCWQCSGAASVPSTDAIKRLFFVYGLQTILSAQLQLILEHTKTLEITSASEQNQHTVKVEEATLKDLQATHWKLCNSKVTRGRNLVCFSGTAMNKKTAQWHRARIFPYSDVQGDMCLRETEVEVRVLHLRLFYQALWIFFWNENNQYLWKMYCGKSGWNEKGRRGG